MVIGMATLVAMQLPVTIIAATAAGLTAGMLSFVDDAGSDAIRFLHLDAIAAGGSEQESPACSSGQPGLQSSLNCALYASTSTRLSGCSSL